MMWLDEGTAANTAQQLLLLLLLPHLQDTFQQ
jgi:hypothetical protein